MRRPGDGDDAPGKSRRLHSVEESLVRSVNGLEVADEEIPLPVEVSTEAGDMDPVLLDEAKWKEIETLGDFAAYEVKEWVDGDRERKEQNGKVISCRWVITISGGIIKCRWCCREFADTVTSEYFAPTTSPATARALDAIALALGLARFTFDARRAFLHVPESEYILTNPPEEWMAWRRSKGLSTTVYWRMLKTLYGRRSAPQQWTDFLAEKLTTHCGLTQYMPIPVYFRKDKAALSLEVHMDDGHGIGTEKEIGDFIDELSKHVLIKWTGPHRASGNSQYSHLHRERILLPEGVIIRPDAKYITSILRMLKLTDAKVAATPIIEEKWDPEDLHECEREEAKLYRSCVGVLLYLVLDRGDLAYVVKELSRYLATPIWGAYRQLKRCARYLKGTQDFCTFMPCPRFFPSTMRGWSDSNWAGCKRTRRSTSCFVVGILGMVLIVVARLQTAIACSSAEAEYYAGVSCAAELLYLKKLFAFLGLHLELELYMDSSGSRGIASRAGVGRVRALETKVLWLQKEVKEKNIVIKAVPGDKNVADLGTKVMAAPKLMRLAAQAGMVRFKDGRIEQLV